MKKLFVFAAIGIISTALTYCTSAKKAAAKAAAADAAAKSTYAATVAPVVASSCSPCHITGKGNKKPYDNYANVKSDIDEIVRRIELNPGEKDSCLFAGLQNYQLILSRSLSNLKKMDYWRIDLQLT